MMSIASILSIKRDMDGMDIMDAMDFFQILYSSCPSCASWFASLFTWNNESLISDFRVFSLRVRLHDLPLVYNIFLREQCQL